MFLDQVGKGEKVSRRLRGIRFANIAENIHPCTCAGKMEGKKERERKGDVSIRAKRISGLRLRGQKGEGKKKEKGKGRSVKGR